MSVIIDPDDLNQATEIVFDTVARPRTIQLLNAGNLTGNKVSLQCVFSFIYEEFKADATLIKHTMPLEPIDGPSGTQFDLSEEWAWKDTTTTDKLAGGGWAWKKANGDSMEEWMNMTSLGAFNDSGSDQAYLTSGDPDSPTDITVPGEINQAIKIFGDATHGNFDHRGDLVLFLREEAKSFETYDLLVEQNITSLAYKQYQAPLSNSPDPLVTHTDAEVGAAPYLNIDLTIYTADQVRDISGTNRNFKRIWEGDSKTLEQIWEKHQLLYRSAGDIDEGVGSLRGDTADVSMFWDSGVLYVDGFIDNVSAADVNRVKFKDSSGTYREYKYASSGKFKPSETLINDPEAYIRLFFENDDAGDNTGRDYGTDTAMLINDNSGAPITFDIAGRSEIEYDFDFDENVQRGVASAATPVPYVAVASGISGALSVVARGEIERTKTNDITLVAGKQLTFSNPA